MAAPSLRVVLTADQIHVRVRELAAQIDDDYPNGRLYLICILKGACFFLVDLARALNREVFIDFIGTSSYGSGQTHCGQVKITKDLDVSVEGADVLIVEDIVDTGLTLDYLVKVLLQRAPRSVRIAALLDKPSRRIAPVQPSYVGFQIPDDFVVGYGLDCAERYRNLKDICALSS